MLKESMLIANQILTVVNDLLSSLQVRVLHHKGALRNRVPVFYYSNHGAELLLQLVLCVLDQGAIADMFLAPNQETLEIHFGIPADDHLVADSHPAGCRSVQGDFSISPRLVARQDVGAETLTIGDIPNLHFLVRKQAASLK